MAADMLDGTPSDRQVGASRLRRGGLAAFSALVLATAFGSAALAQAAGPVEIPLPVIPQGNYLNPGPVGPVIQPDVPGDRGPNDDYANPPQFGDGDGSGPPGDPTANDGAWSPLPSNTPSFE